MSCPAHARPRAILIMLDLGVWTAVSICCLLSTFFVVSLYVVDPGLPRDDPLTVKRRICVIAIVCLVAPCALYLFIWSHSYAISVVSFAGELGLKWTGLFAAIVYPTLLILTLYAGPIFHSWIDGNILPNIASRRDIFLRNFVVAPFAEELVFRGCMLPLLYPALGEYYAVLVCPLFFGIAHAHHLIEWYRRNDGTSFNQACVSIVIQFCYTSIFGLFAGFLFARTGHLAALFFSHALCNLMGLPPIESAIMHPKKQYILPVYTLGIVLFICLLFPLTTPLLYE